VSAEPSDETRPVQPPAHLPTRSEDGVDLTLIRWMLSLTPVERLRVLQNNVRAILRIRNAPGSR
jgi:hypothetical protein